MNYRLRIEMISVYIIYLIDISINCIVQLMHMDFMCAGTWSWFPIDPQKDDGVVWKKVPTWLTHIFHAAGWKPREDFTYKRHVGMRVGCGLGHSYVIK